VQVAAFVHCVIGPHQLVESVQITPDLSQRVVRLHRIRLVCTGKSARGGASAVTNLPEFEVASVRAHPSGYWPTFSSFEFTADGFHAKNVQAQYLIIYAFDLRDPGLRFKGNLLKGAPSWVQSDWYDIEAKMSEADAAKLSLTGEIDVASAACGPFQA
jgi:hypothetical protein